MTDDEALCARGALADVVMDFVEERADRLGVAPTADMCAAVVELVDAFFSDDYHGELTVLLARRGLVTIQ